METAGACGTEKGILVGEVPPGGWVSYERVYSGINLLINQGGERGGR